MSFKSVRSKLALKHTPLNLIGRQGITSIRGYKSRCKQRAKRLETRDESSSGGTKKSDEQEQDEAELL